jgi:modulator of FtsH protease HflK
MAGNGRFGRSGDPFGEVLDRLRGLMRRAGAIVLALVGALLLFSSYYQVEPAEVGIVTRFGRYTGSSPPGPHLKIPLGIERVQFVPVERQLKLEFGFRTAQAGVRTAYARDQESEAESMMLTGDLNVANVEWIVQYKIADPYRYLFKVRDVEATLRLASEAVMREVVGDRNVTELLTVGREAIAMQAKQRLSELTHRYEMGIDIQQLVLQDVDPPAPVRPSFNEVNEAIQERQRAINEAWSEYNQEIPRARGRAEQTVQAAEGYAAERVNKARGDGERFVALYDEYKKAPEVTRTRLYLEMLGQVLPTAGRKVVVDEKLRSVLPLLSVGKEAK